MTAGRPCVLIVRPGSTAPEVRASRGDFDRWFTDALQGEGLDYEIADATAGSVEARGEYAGVIVTGSSAAVYRQAPWMDRLCEFLRDEASGDRPMLGVCFGAQILAHAFGGRVERNPRGWEIGGIRISLTEEGLADPLFAGLPPVAGALATHEDHITALPEGARLLSSNECATVQAFRLRPHVWGVQFHPEITPEILRILIRLRRDLLEADASASGRPVEGHVDRLLGSLDEPAVLDGRRVLKNFAAILRNGTATSRE